MVQITRQYKQGMTVVWYGIMLEDTKTAKNKTRKRCRVRRQRANAVTTCEMKADTRN